MNRTLLVTVLACACSASQPAAPTMPSIPRMGDGQLSASESEFLLRLAERMRRPRNDTPTVMNGLEHLLPQWHGKQRLNEEGPLENILTIEVVTHFDQVLGTFRTGGRERRLIAAWALGFSRVPSNTMGITSPHPQAISALTDALEHSDDELLRNELLALWKLADPATPTAPLLDMMVRHHDPDVRANATLALGTILTSSGAARMTDQLLLALADSEPRVRVHATGIAQRFPQPASTRRLEQLLLSEEWPYVRAAMATALGAARSRSAGPALVSMLGSVRAIEVGAARIALTQIFGVDRGPDPAAWADLVR
jgi:hypothetical protein